MFKSTSIEIVKLLGCKRISHSFSKNDVQNFSFDVKKTCESQFLYCHSKKCLLKLKWHAVFSTSKLHGLPHCGPTVLANSQKICTSRVCNYQTKSMDFNKEDDDNSETENKGRNVLDDLEFHSILKDFAKDFGVGEENRPFLEEIKQQNPSPCDDNCAEKPGKTCTNNELDFSSGTEVRTNKCSPFSSNEFHELNDSPSVHHFEKSEEDNEEFFHIDQELEERAEYDVKRGKGGVYDIGDLVTVLRKENLIDICVIQVPVSFHYADYLVLATAKSPRHCQAIMEFIIKLYKQKKNKGDPFVKCEGKTNTTWKALDMGNIVLHIFLEATRKFYDIEPLWLLDKKFDDVGSLKSDPHLDMMQKHMDFLNSLSTQ